MPLSAHPDHARSRLSVEPLEDRRTPAAMLTVAGTTILEGDDGSLNAVVRVSLTEPHGNSVSVNYSTADSTATAGSDYTPVSGKLTFTRGQTSKDIMVPVLGDKIGEYDESLLFRLTDAKGAKFASSQASVTIQDNEPRVSITGGSVYEGNDGQTLIDFTVSLSRASGETVKVDFATANYDAIAGEDYVSAFGTLTFAPGDTSETFTVAVLGDTTAEPDEYFTVNLAVTSNSALLVTSSVYSAIYDDDGYYDYYYDPGYYDPGYYYGDYYYYGYY